MPHADFVHLHLHTEYSLLDGAISVENLVKKAVDLKMPAVAVTDHGNLFSVIDFYQKALKGGVKPIIGCEIYVAPGSRFEKAMPAGRNDEEFYHLILLARNRQGYKNLVKLVTSAFLEGFYYKPRIDKDLLRKHAEGLIGLSACLGGEIPSLLLQNRYEDAKKVALDFRAMLGEENFYLELQDNGIPEQEQANRELLKLSKDTGIPVVATNDCHYLDMEDHKAHDALLCIQTGKTVKDANRMRFSSETFYMKTPEEMKKSFSYIPEAIANTIKIAERCNLELELGKYHLPHFPLPEGYDVTTYLAELARKGLEERFAEIEAVMGPGTVDRDAYRKRLESEIAMIIKMGFPGYFLIVADFIRYGKDHGIPVGPGRGSAAGSLVAFSMRITDLDPIPYNLLFERFLNPERISMPDIDVDFCQDRRDEVIKYVTEKYGADHVTQIITYGTMLAKGVIRDVGRVLDIPYAEVDKVAKLVPNKLNITLKEALEQEPKLKELTKKDSRMAELMEIAQALEGQVRHASKHAAGVVISKEPLTEYVPLFKTPKDEITTQFDMKAVEKIGLVKFDFLGLRNLTVIRKAEDLINQRLQKAPLEHADAFSVSRLRLDDPKVYELLGRGDNAGIFQVESGGMRDILIKMKPQTFEDLIAILALYRPGPLNSGMVDDFIKRKKGLTRIVYDLPQLEPILKDTYGVIVYQEQVMQISRTLAGYSLGQADLLRRAMGKKDPEVMKKEKVPFLDGAKKLGVDLKKAESIFDLMAQFAEYGFNKSHSAAYALVTYQTAYLKAHYPVEYMAALLTSEVENTDKIVKYIYEARQMGIVILQPDANESRWDFTVVEAHERDTVEPGSTIGTIRFGLAAVKNVGYSAIEAIIEAREAKGAFTSFADFCRKVDQRRVNRRVIEALIKCGALDFTGSRRAQMTEGIDLMMSEAERHQDQEAIGQVSIFDTMGDKKDPDLPNVAEWKESQLLAYEKESMGFYLSGHPLAAFEADLKRYVTGSIEQLDAFPDGKEVVLCGIIAGLKQKLTKKNDKMAIMNLEDLAGAIEVIVFPDLYKTAQHLLVTDAPLIVRGTLDKSEQGNKIKALSVSLLTDIKKKGISRMDIRLSATGLTKEDLTQVKEILLKHKGDIPVFLRLQNPTRPESLISVGRELRIAPNDKLIAEIEALIGAGAVSVS
ncbi:MAG: DNA polymerase III subunit alpha [Nitrospiraceae bacterium]|nr:DNA polymerase III subunit alpha [Nitrospiraceae bacterium]